MKVLMLIPCALLLACSGGGGGGASGALGSLDPQAAPSLGITVQPVAAANPPSVTPNGFTINQSAGSHFSFAEQTSPQGYSVSVGVDPAAF